MNRREFITAAAAAVPFIREVRAQATDISGRAASSGQAVFAHRGYYICFMRLPTLGLAAWREIVDGAAEDGANTIILWMAGAFRSKKFPITWQWAEEHENVREDFARKLIAHAHRRGIKVLLGFTPFGYDGVNQFAIEHPELKARKGDGAPVDEFGIGCWGWNLCPAKVESQRFMRDYISEMAFEFYPDADGLFIESSDYSVCQCPDCGPKYFDHEFQFVREISTSVWSRNANATVVVYPHYFSGAKLQFSFTEATAAKHAFDPRWTLFFTPHSAQIEPALIKKARSAWWWNDSPARLDIAGIRSGVKQALAAGCDGYVPSFESFSYVPPKGEFGEPWIAGRRQVPFGFGWLREGEHPYNELPVRAVRMAYRELTANPELTDEQLNEQLGARLFGPDWRPSQVKDLFDLIQALNIDRNWSVPGALTTPDLVRHRIRNGNLDEAKRKNLREHLDRVRAIADRYKTSTHKGARELFRIANWVASQWEGVTEL